MATLLFVVIAPILFFRIESKNCIGRQACYGQHITCAAGKDCTIVCDGNDSDQPCTSMTVDAQNAASLTFQSICGSNSSVDTQCTYGTQIFCPSNHKAECRILCSFATSCDSLIITGASSGSLQLTSTGFNAVIGTIAYCPKHSCNIIGDSQQQTSLQGLTVYANNSFSDVTFQCAGNTGICFNSLTLYCQLRTALWDNCQVSRVTLDSCAGSTVCNVPTTKPSKDPTTSPTMSPTMAPTMLPTVSPSTAPTMSPSMWPTISPTVVPTTSSIIIINENGLWANIEYILLCTVMIICIGALLYTTWIKFFGTKKAPKIRMEIRIIAISQLISFCLSYLIWLICIIVLYSDSGDHTNGWYIFFAILQYSFWIIGWLSFYILLLYTLFQTFNETVYKMSKRFLYFHIVVIAFIPIWYGFMFIYGEMVENESIVYFVCSAFGFVLILFGMFTLVFSFNHNLFMFMSARNRKESMLGEMSERRSTTASSDSQRSVFLPVVGKQTLLGSTMLLSGIIFLFVILSISVSTKNGKDATSTEWIIYEWFNGVYVLINVVCVYLGWKVNATQYYLVCGKCHSMLIWGCETLIKKRFKRYNKINIDMSASNDLTANFSL